jgi:Flp pilus assembly protein CpaB
MRRSRTFILLAMVLLLVAVALFLLLNRQPPPPKTPEPTAQAVPTTKIVVAFQNIPRGGQIITGAVGLFDWPTSQMPPSAYQEADIGRAIGKFAKIDIPQGLPVLPSMVATSPAEAAAAGGSVAALAILPGKVGVAFPFRSTYPERENLPYDRRDKEVLPRLLSVAFAVQPGDRVDVLACFWVYDLDKEFQTRLPNVIGYIDPQNPSKPVEGLAGRPVVAPGGGPGVEAPAEPQLPRMVCQWTVQNARVLGLGDWGVALTPPTPAPGGGPTPTPAPALPQVATLEVDPQDALVLKYAREMGAQIDLVLRAAGDKESRFSTEAVTLQYMFERFRIAIPPKLDYTIGGGGGVPVGAKNP